MKPFDQMSDAECDAFLWAHADELHMLFDSGELLASVANGTAVIERTPCALAVIDLKAMPDGHSPHLRAIYVRPEMRGRKHGRRFVRALIRKHCDHYHMTLSCFGAKRREFFGRVGFRVERREGEWRYMTTNDYRGFSGY